MKAKERRQQERIQQRASGIARYLDDAITPTQRSVVKRLRNKRIRRATINID